MALACQSYVTKYYILLVDFEYTFDNLSSNFVHKNAAKML